MAQRRIYFDKTEIVFMVPTKNNIARYNLSAKEIIRIQFDKDEKKIFGIFKSESETITIVSGKLAAPLVYKKSQNKKYFSEYKRDFERFTKENHVSFTDNTK